MKTLIILLITLTLVNMSLPTIVSWLKHQSNRTIGIAVINLLTILLLYVLGSIHLGIEDPVSMLNLIPESRTAGVIAIAFGVSFSAWSLVIFSDLNLFKHEISK